MLKPYISVLITLCLIAVCARGATPEAVNKSIGMATTWLYQHQQNGNWEELPAPDPKGKNRDAKGGQFTGPTALAVLALLNTGESPQDPRIKDAVDFLLKTPTKGVYALGIRCQMWAMLPQTPAIREALKRDAGFLFGSIKTTGPGRGMYDYTPNPTGKSYSHSRSQYAVLGMWAADQAGGDVPDSYWKMVEEAWRRNQDLSGGWTYANPADTKWQPTPGMTTVGVASLFITQEYLHAPEGITCRGNDSNDAIDRGIKWLGDNMGKFATDQPYARDFVYPTLYAYERVGAASGYRYFGGIDWYEKGADWAIKRQAADGSWSSATPDAVPQLADTCFAMLFLAKGRAPIAISKLHYNGINGKEGKWDQRSRDVPNMIKWVGRTIERDLAFQVLDENASLADLLEAPLLYISGNEKLALPDVEKIKIKAYIEGGGILIANADCGGEEFTASIKALGKEMFPYTEFSELPEDDLIYTTYYPRSKWKSKPSVLTLNNGARNLIVLFPQADPGKAWQLQDSKSKVELFELAADLFLYSVDQQNLRNRGDRFYVPEDPSINVTKSIPVVRLKYPGAWDPEPGGWRRLSNTLVQRKATTVPVTVAELGKNELGTAKIAHLTGTYEYKFTDAQCDELKKFITAGGTLIIDCAGGNSSFVTSVEEMLTKAFPKDKPEILPPDHALYLAGGGPVDPVTYRSFAIKNGVGKMNVPRLQGITINGRLAVIYSREDLSVGLVGQSVAGITGYSPATATNLMTRILTYNSTVEEPKPAAPAPTPAPPPTPDPATTPATKPAKSFFSN